MMNTLSYNNSPEIITDLELERRANDFIIDNNRNRFYLTLGKRIFDVVTSIFIIVFVLSWVCPIIGILIILDSSGSIFFIQRRTGYRGVSFNCYKFRTMYDVKQIEFRQTSFNDSRVTRVGHFLRRTNLDELPQFINVLLGHMSIVGPRPHAVEHDKRYWSSAEYRRRYSIKPGITGLAQVRGARGETEKDQKMLHRVRYDLFYAKHLGFRVDIFIFIDTIKTMLKGDKNAW